jgi:hypothetical protein
MWKAKCGFEDNIKVYILWHVMTKVCGLVDMAEGRIQWRDFLNTVTSFRVSCYMKNFYTI